MADAAQDSGKQPAADQEKPKTSTPRVATEYVALVQDEREGSGTTMLKPLPGTFSGFKREDVLDELVTGGKLTPDEQTGKTPYVYIVPARGFQRLRGTVQVTKKVVVE